MERGARVTTEPEEPHRSQVNDGLRVSIQSVVWTVVASSAAVALGLRDHTAVLVAFGAIGFVDAVGSIALVHHFRHGLRHDRLSEDLERLAHRVVLVGLLLVGCAAIIGGLALLAIAQPREASNASVVLAAASLVALSFLSVRKQSIATRVSSNALRSDGHLSAIGAMQAAIALAGIAAARWVSWQWADAAATTVVGCVAAALAIVTWTAEARRRFNPRWTVPRAAFVVVSAIAFADALLGQHVILIGLLVAGPALAAISIQPRATGVVSAWSLVLAVALGAVDSIWLTTEHAVWVGTVLLVGVTNTAVITTVARWHRNLQLESPCARISR